MFLSCQPLALRMLRWLMLMLCLSMATLALATSPATVKTVTDGAYHYQLGPTPQWVEEQAMPTQWPKAFAPDAAFRVWRLDLQWHLAHGNYVDYAWEPTNTKTVESAGQYSIEFDPSWQELVIHEITRTRAGKQVDLRSESGVLTLARREQSFEAVGFSGRVSALVVVPAIQPGDVMRIRYSTLGLHPLLKSTTLLQGFYLESQNPFLEWRIRFFCTNLTFVYNLVS